MQQHREALLHAPARQNSVALTPSMGEGSQLEEVSAGTATLEKFSD